MPDFPGIQRAIEKTGNVFPRYAVVLYENDSQDQTMEEIEAWGRRNDRVVFESETLKRGRASNSDYHYEWLAQYRNLLLDRILSSEYDWADYVVMLNQDIQPWAVDSLLSVFVTQVDDAGRKVPFDKWDKICANRVKTTGGLSDLFSFRDVNWPTWDSRNIAAMQRYCYWPFDDALVPVTACYGSFAIYRREALRGCRYAGHDKHNKTTSEHVMLDECMATNGHTRLYLSPKVVAHPPGRDYFVYPVLQTLGIADIIHGRNVPFKLIQFVCLLVLPSIGMVAAWVLVAYCIKRLNMLPRYIQLNQTDS